MSKQFTTNQGYANTHFHGPGFSLVELLISAMAGVVLLLGASQLLISHIQTSTRIEARLRLQDTWSRLQFLLDQEIQEARSASVSGNTLTLQVPSGSSGANTSQIVYSYNSSSKKLERSGPAINADGSLDFDNASTAPTVSGNISEFVPVLVDTGGQTVQYTISLSDPSGASYSDQASASIGRPRIIN